MNRIRGILFTLFLVSCVTPQPESRPVSAAPPIAPELPAIVQTGESVLRSRAQEVPVQSIATPEFQALVSQMIAVMRAAPGVGLAAPQIGVPWRVIVLEDRDDLIANLNAVEITERERVAFAPRVFVNPELRLVGDESAMFFEGCLSVDGFVGMVTRHREVEVSGLDEHGKPQTWRVKGWPARILQHEMDHLNGMLYIDRMLTHTFSTARLAKAHFAGKPIAEIKARLGLDK